ncbi:MAG: hypothetical protein FRX48_07119 [Lasallia pustulata]|uniref:Uncharacterized protein n=1 Tax=Lasallia pustulata TaxID=136370 RepID=A0A5M8PIU9_9LECA|nr:MAG: hypothetical protein FRX48_07119 [Lasallia pustulata]
MAPRLNPASRSTAVLALFSLVLALIFGIYTTLSYQDRPQPLNLTACILALDNLDPNPFGERVLAGMEIAPEGDHSVCCDNDAGLPAYIRCDICQE